MDFIGRSELYDYLRNKSLPQPFGLIPKDGKINIDNAENKTIIEFNDLRFNLSYIDNLDKSILIRTGLPDLDVSFRPSSSNKPRFNFDYESNNTITSWLNSLIQNTSETYETFYLIPDTNFLINCYYTNYFQEIVKKNPYRLQMMIPRLPILELELQANSAEDVPKEKLTDFEKLIDKFDKIFESVSSETPIKNQDLKKFQELKESFAKFSIKNQIKCYKKRIAFQGLSEVYSMLSDGSSVFPDIIFPSKFFNSGGNIIADSLIRMEIANNISNRIELTHIFVTSDFTSALAASAENINSLYIRSTGTLITDAVKQFENLLYQCAIYFGECIIYKIKSDGSKEGKRIEGMWSGKNFSHWNNYIVRCSNI